MQQIWKILHAQRLEKKKNILRGFAKAENEIHHLPYRGPQAKHKLA